MSTWFRTRTLLRRRPRLAFFALGFLSAALCGWLLLHQLEIAHQIFGMEVAYDTRPAWLRRLMMVVKWFPLGMLAAMTAVRLSRGPSVRPLAFAAGAVSLYVLFFGSLFFGPDLEDHWHRRAFEPAGWRRSERRDAMWPARLTMVDDLVTRHLLQGLGGDSVERLLGPSDSTDYFRDWDRVYRLGPERGLIRIDSEWLVLKLGPDGRVTDYRIVRD